MNYEKSRRRRGVLLTPQGLTKLLAAKSQIEFLHNQGIPHTLEKLNEMTRLAPDTLRKIFSADTAIDKNSLQRCFRAFNLVLEENDYYRPNPQIQASNSTVSCNQPTEVVLATDEVKLPKAQKLEPPLPGSQLPLDSVFYIHRHPLESLCYETICQPGAFITIKGPEQMGKTSLMARILHLCRQQGYYTIALSLHLSDKTVFSSLDRFLRWFCACIGKNLRLKNRLTDFWNDIYGVNYNTTNYFENYLLVKIDAPLVIALDDVDCIFDHYEIASDFFALVHAWHEKAKYGDSSSFIWEKLRLVVSQSTKFSIPLNMNQSPLNFGLSIELPNLNRLQVEDLVRQYQINLSAKQIDNLMVLVGGHPYLLQATLYHLWHQDVSSERLLQESLVLKQLYREHLEQKFWNLKRYPELAAAFSQVVKTKEPIKIDSVKALKLQNIGLVNVENNQVISICDLYRQYFCNLL